MWIKLEIVLYFIKMLSIHEESIADDSLYIADSYNVLYNWTSICISEQEKEINYWQLFSVNKNILKIIFASKVSGI